MNSLIISKLLINYQLSQTSRWKCSSNYGRGGGTFLHQMYFSILKSNCLVFSDDILSLWSITCGGHTLQIWLTNYIDNRVEGLLQACTSPEIKQPVIIMNFEGDLCLSLRWYFNLTICSLGTPTISNKSRPWSMIDAILMSQRKRDKVMMRTTVRILRCNIT